MNSLLPTIICLPLTQILLFIIFIVNVCCSQAFILKKSIVSEPSMLLTAAALTGNSQKRKEWWMNRAKQTWRRLWNFYMALFISKFFQKAQSTEPKLFVSTATLNCLITGVLHHMTVQFQKKCVICYFWIHNWILRITLRLIVINHRKSCD